MYKIQFTLYETLKYYLMNSWITEDTQVSIKYNDEKFFYDVSDVPFCFLSQNYESCKVVNFREEIEVII